MASTGLMNLFGIGAANKADGSKSNPFYVVQSDLFGNSVTATAGTSGAMSGGSFNTSSITGAFSGIGGLFSKFFGMFGGFLADGGDVTPGKAYMVGEKHPEFFIPGQVAPMLKTQGGGGTTVNHFAFNGVTDHNSFKQNEAQLANKVATWVSRGMSRR